MQFNEHLEGTFILYFVYIYACAVLFLCRYRIFGK